MTREAEPTCAVVGSIQYSRKRPNLTVAKLKAEEAGALAGDPQSRNAATVGGPDDVRSFVAMARRALAASLGGNIPLGSKTIFVSAGACSQPTANRSRALTNIDNLGYLVVTREVAREVPGLRLKS